MPWHALHSLLELIKYLPEVLDDVRTVICTLQVKNIGEMSITY